jgi:hypothetical protein
MKNLCQLQSENVVILDKIDDMKPNRGKKREGGGLNLSHMNSLTKKVNEAKGMTS